ncbi:MAG: DASS family sodium-coupled anion symporter [Bdellovibrionales bacterium]|nr:DASS family sodium-coupled anion symporter [Bdellovibrionales bacterium]
MTHPLLEEDFLHLAVGLPIISSMRTVLLFLLFLITPPIILSGLSFEPLAPTALFLTIVLLWFTELVPLPVTGLLVPVLIGVYGILPVKEAFRPFGSDILFLFIGCFLLAQSMTKHGWDKRMAFFLLSREFGTRSTESLILLVGTACWILSMWVSNTATCAMMTPVCLGIARLYTKETDAEQGRSFTLRLLFTCAFASSIGGLATPIGTPPNLIAFEFLKNEGFDLGFFDWVSLAMPLSFLMLISLYFLLRWRYPLRIQNISNLRGHFKHELEALGPIQRGELQVAAVFTLAVVFWVLPGLAQRLWPTVGIFDVLQNRASMSVVGIVAGLLLFLCPLERSSKMNLEWKDAQQIDWGTILLFGGGLSLGAMLNSTGLAQIVGEYLLQPESGYLAILCTVVVLGVLISEFASNTASASILLPMVLSVLVSSGTDPSLLLTVVVAGTLSASFGFMLPVSTPPNAIIYGTGEISVREMIRAGVLFDLLGMGLILLGAVFFFPLVL